MTLYEQTLGLVASDDVVSLAPGLRLDGSSILLDEPANARHVLRDDAYQAVKMLYEPIEVGYWQRQCGLTQTQAAELIRFLDSIAGLSVRRTFTASVRCLLLRLYMRLQGIRPVVAAVRYQGSYWAVVLAVLRATVPVAMMMLLVIGLGYGGGVFGVSFAAAQIVLLVSVFVTTSLHEGVHLWFARRASRPAVVIVRGVRVGVLHSTFSAQHELMSALAGPASGALLASAICAVTMAAGQSWLMVGSAAMVAIFHICSWLPEYGDGITIKQYLRGWYAKKA